MENEVRDICAPSLLEKQPLVSVCMLTYMHERFIARAIEGVVTQLCDFPFELIIAEDCSPDDTLKIAMKYQEKYPDIIRVITGERNVGIHNNSRRSYQFCRGEFIAHCEGDDFWHRNDKLQLQIPMLRSDSDMVLCHTDFNRQTRFRLKESCHKQKTGRYRPASGRAYASLLYTWSVMSATSVYRKKVILDFLASPFYNPKWPFGDLNYLLYTSLQGTFGYLDVSTATFTKVRGSAGNSGFVADLNMQLAAEECVNMYMAQYPVSPEDARHITAERKRSIYSRSFYADRPDLLVSSFAWLSKNGFAPSRIKHVLKLFALKTRLPYLFLKTCKSFFVNHISCLPA
jgi:glycosyltransferase involved in cell wall biosynthesis